MALSKRRLFVTTVLIVGLVPAATAEPHITSAAAEPAIRPTACQVADPEPPGLLPLTYNDSATRCNP